MPLAADPNQTVGVTLKHDADLPAEQRAVFTYRHFTCRHLTQFNAIVAAAQKEPDDDKCSALLHEAIGFRIVGWENLRDPDSGEPIPFDPADIAAVGGALTPMEKWTLCYAVRAAVGIATPQKKVSASPANTAPEKSSPDAEGPASA